MKTSSRSRSPWRQMLVSLFAVTFFAQSGLAWQTAAAPKAAPALTAAEKKAVAGVKLETIREITKALSAPEMQGRGTAQPGGDKAAKYLAARFQALGLKPLGDAGTYLQSINFKSAQVQPGASITAGDQTLKLRIDFIAAPPLTGDKNIEGKLAFAGYGRASEVNALDLAGKVAIVVLGPPKGVEKAVWDKENASQSVVFRLLGKKAAGVILANFGSPDQPYAMVADYLTRRSVSLADAVQPPATFPPIILVSDAGAEKLLTGSGSTYAQARAAADAGETAARVYETTVKINIPLKQETGIGSNVIGVLEGADPTLKEQAVVFSAHYDAFGVGADNRIYPGAADNALGVGEILSIAETLTHAQPRPRRSIIFLAVTGEEYGLLGAEHWVKHPTWKLDNVAADINLDGIGTEVWGPVKRIIGFGSEHSTLGAALEAVVAATGNVVAPDPLPEEKVFYRSDHFAFVKKGVPSLMLLGTPDIDADAMRTRAKKWMATDYHQPGDIVRPEWDWTGAQTVAVIGLLVGMRVADTDAMPAWLPSSQFNKARGGAAAAKPQ